MFVTIKTRMATLRHLRAVMITNAQNNASRSKIRSYNTTRKEFLHVHLQHNDATPAATAMGEKEWGQRYKKYIQGQHFYFTDYLIEL